MIYILHDTYYDEVSLLIEGPEMDQSKFRDMYSNYWVNHPSSKWHDEFWPIRDNWFEVNYNLPPDPEHKAYTKFYNDYIEKNPCPPRHSIEDFVATVLVPLGFKVISFTDVCL